MGWEPMCHHRGYDYLAERLREETSEEDPIADAPADEFDIGDLDDEDEREREPLVPPADD